jgi:hypothetical protein
MDGLPELERFFQVAGGVVADQGDVYRFRTFADEKVDAMAFAGRDAARANGRDVIAPQDLPITSGLREQMHDFDRRDDAEEIRAVLRKAPRRPPGDVTFAEGTQDVLVEVFGGIALALARAFPIVHPDVRHPATEHWTRVFDLYRLVL